MKDEFRNRVIRYLASELYIFDNQLPSPDDPDVDTLRMAARDLGIQSEVDAVYAYIQASDED